MAKKYINLIGIVALIILITFLFKGFNFQIQSIIPEIDNRITYFDKNTDMSELVNTKHLVYENDKMYCEGNLAHTINPDNFVLGVPDNRYSEICALKKDFSRPQTYIRYTTYGESGGLLRINGHTFSSTVKGEFDNVEIIPDNLNTNIYNVFVNGEFKAETGGAGWDKLIIAFEVGTTGSGSSTIQVDYVKYIPIEAYTIRNDEVWVQEVRGSDYSYSDLNWEMIGYQSQIRPATIRDLATQTEVPAPQIYVNLINNKKVSVQPNTVHSFFYRTKWVEGLDSSCKGQLDKVERKVGDKWVCDSYVKETPIIQQCQTKADCPILPECENLRETITCTEQKICDYSSTSIACKNQLITYQEKVTEIENTKFVPIISGGNSFYCFFDETQSSCNVGEKTISISSPLNTCVVSSSSDVVSNSDCFKTEISFNGKSYSAKNNQEVLTDYNIKIIPSIGATFTEGKIRKGWSIVTKVTLPDNFLDVTPKELGNKFILQNSNDRISFIITNKLGFGIDGGYSIQTQNLALEGGVILQDIDIPLFLKSGENIVTYNFKTEQLGTILDLIGIYGKVKTDKEYILKSSQNGKQKFLIINKEVVVQLPQDIGKVQPQIIEKPIIVEKIVEVPAKSKKIPTIVWVIGGALAFLMFLKLIRVI